MPRAAHVASCRFWTALGSGLEPSGGPDCRRKAVVIEARCHFQAAASPQGYCTPAKLRSSASTASDGGGESSSSRGAAAAQGARAPADAHVGRDSTWVTRRWMGGRHPGPAR